MTGPRLIVRDLEENIAAPGTGEGVIGIMCTAIEMLVDCTVTVSIIVASPPHLPNDQ